MICETCHGKGFIADEQEWPYDKKGQVICLWAPCPTCQGSGITSCCDGMIVIEEAEKRA